MTKILSVLVTCMVAGALCASAATTGPVDVRHLPADLKRLAAFSTALEGMLGEMNRMRKTMKGTKRGHFTSDEHDQIENLLFRYVGIRESLWEIVNRYRDYQKGAGQDEEQTKAFIVAFSAALHLAYYSSTLVETFMDEPAVIDKLNEPYHRSDRESARCITLWTKAWKSLQWNAP